MVIIDFLSTGSARKVMGQIHAKVGDRNSCILGGLFTIEVEMGMTD